jgi:transporter family protein
MWLFYALLSALSAALVAIFAKMGLSGVNSTLATTIRGVIMALFLLLVSIVLSKFDGFSFTSFSGRDWVFIVLAGIAGALSWLFYFFALQKGPASGVVAIDRTSLVFVVVLAALFLGETLSWKVGIGAVLMVAGALLISL